MSDDRRTEPGGGERALATESPATAAPEQGEAIEQQDALIASTAADSGTAMVAGSFGEYVRTWVRRVRHGESGMLPVIVGLIIIVVIFQVKSPVFLSALNLTNLISQGAALILLGMAEVFVLLLGEIDLSIGYVAGVSAVVTVALASSQLGPDWPWWIALIAGLLVGATMCALEGLLITRLGLPSFVVTLAGLLGYQGVLLYLVNKIGGPSGGGTISITNRVLINMVNGNLSPLAGWIVMIVAVALYAVLLLRRSLHRRANGLVVEPLMLTIVKIGAIAVAGVVVVVICNINRGGSVVGVPWVVPIILVVLTLWTFVLGRTRFGRYIYAIGGSAEAARRAGINLARIRLAAFTLGGLTAGMAGAVYASLLGSISNNVDGGQLVLYAVAAAVIGGTSLFGGRGKMLHALVGGIIVAVIQNGMGLIGLDPATQLVVTALVLLAAVVVDAVARRGRTSS